ncbi:MAG: bactofilin family protein [Gammaproteobacteria bacterium]
MARRKSHSVIETLIGTNTTLSGDVNFSDGLYLEGRIEGNVNGADADAYFDINDDGRMVGEVRVVNANANGMVEGEVHVSGRLHLGPKARVDGNVFLSRAGNGGRRRSQRQTRTPRAGTACNRASERGSPAGGDCCQRLIGATINP